MTMPMGRFTLILRRTKQGLEGVTITRRLQVSSLLTENVSGLGRRACPRSFLLAGDSATNQRSKRRLVAALLQRI